ncbi:MAG TPA: hypothetical protein VMW76_07135 [Bacteroidales bacterium]|nr:hypothetical protein [Bacteroidales bacterium]
MKKVALILVLLIGFIAGKAQNQTPAENSIIQNTAISGEWYLGFGYNDGTDINQFNLKRGYLTFKTKISDILSVRYTQDITTDTEGGDIGNVEMRLKYLYLKIDLKRNELLRNTYFEIGLVHRPWIDFEQKLTGYRVQGKMFLDRFDITTSADFGITYAGLLGGKISDQYQQKVSSDYPGRYGSFAIGVYNGGGYHALEKNNNKVIDGRFTLRPFPDAIPGVQISYAFAFGKSNVPGINADYRLNLFHLSTESRIHKLMIQYYRGTGGHDGDYLDLLGYSYKNDGFSAFGEFLIPDTKFSILGRFDRFNSHQDEKYIEDTYIGGIAYRFLENKVLLNYDQKKIGDQSVRLYEIALEINFQVR